MDSPPDDEVYYSPAEYRVRLFLSVDLSGSTAFKNSSNGEKIHGATPKWVTVFQHFYSDFPNRFRTNYVTQKNDLVGTDRGPEIWKAVGDELVFCGRVTNKKSVAASLTAFIKTLHDYRKYLLSEGLDLNVKGAGWIAAFPEPNRAVQLRPIPDKKDFISATEALELAADDRPFDYDFLGKAIDSGFRVATSASPERFALCAQLARLLAGTEPGFGFDYEIRLDQPMLLKGVNRGEPYPALYIDTMAHLKSEALRKKERELLGRHAAPSRERLADYLKMYCDLVGTDEIMLALDAQQAKPAAPTSYSEHRDLMATHLTAERGREFDGTETEVATADADIAAIEPGEDLNPLSE